ncbi:uncharacterized protein LOC112597380 isoform X2 [Melanaphis sacchari]|uniref:uncharacterized protein LOC112597380 isoform X2 n=1 Tax=Melanaphis sacchari TaxID=742174 RepID=UPI000DC14E0A|nr:uncharacterized protein LOC112597380 isoform X2 [Melanaphis sacchari]
MMKMKTRKQVFIKKPVKVRIASEADIIKKLEIWYTRWTKSIGRPLTPLNLKKKTIMLLKTLRVSTDIISIITLDWIKKFMKNRGNLEGYDDDEIYAGLLIPFDVNGIPDVTFNTTINPDRKVWLLMAGNKSGRHRTRVLVIGKRWRPPCMETVNMLGQPVIYAGGGDGFPTQDLFKWWFETEFCPAALSINSKAVLVMDKASFIPEKCEYNGVSLQNHDGDSISKSTLFIEFKATYTALLLTQAALDQQSERSIQRFLEKYTLKDAFILLHRAWLQVTTESFSTCWKNCAYTSALKGIILGVQWLAHDLGLEVSDEDMLLWILSNPVEFTEPENLSTDSEDIEIPPSATQTVDYLKKALLWVETQPLEPSFVIAIRDLITYAKQASKIGLGPAHPFFCHNGEQLGTQPPPAHMGIPPYQLDKAPGLPRPSMYPFPTGQYPYPLLSPDMSQVAATWHTPASMYHQISSAGTGFRGSYPPSLGTSLTSELYRFSPTGLMSGPSPHHHLSHHTHHSHPAIVTPGVRQDLHTDSNHRPQNDHSKNSSCSDGSKHHDTVQNSNNQDKKKPHIKKPLNAFMLYMKEMRAKVVAECTLKESAAINQILGRRWHALGREEQAKYYELARRERQIHMQLYPDWSSRTNATRAKKRKRKQETHDGGNNSMKKCRARYGLDQQSQWCKPCRRKKRCIRYIESGGDSGNQSDDNQSTGSLGHSDNEEADSASSPGGLSALSSLTSPGMLTQASLSPATPLTPHVSEYECPPMAARMPLAVVVPTRHHQPVGTNPHDINNPLSVNQLTGGVVNNKCHNNPREQHQHQQQQQQHHQHQQQNDLKTVPNNPNNQPEQQQRPNNNSNRTLPAISVT